VFCAIFHQFPPHSFRIIYCCGKCCLYFLVKCTFIHYRIVYWLRFCGWYFKRIYFILFQNQMDTVRKHLLSGALLATPFVPPRSDFVLYVEKYKELPMIYHQPKHLLEGEFRKSLKVLGNAVCICVFILIHWTRNIEIVCM